jgi:acyl-CoA-binding protein
MNKRFTSIALIVHILVIHAVYAQTYSLNEVPQRIILNLTASPENSMAVTWRTNEEFKASEVQYAVSTQWTDFKKSVTKVNAKTEKFGIDDHQFVYHHSVVLDGLKPGTTYVYRVGHDSVWSEWNQFKTASKENAPFKFVYLGDPQNDIKEHVSRVFREAYKLAPDASFWLYAGDLAAYPTDDLWGELFYAAGFIYRVTPSIMIPGNHDRSVVLVDGKEKRLKTTDPIWKAHFTLPENGITGCEETSYYVDYQGVRFLMLNTNDKLEEQAEWMEKLLSKNPNKWTIVTLHYPLYNSGSDHDTKGVRIALLPIIDKYNVDLVLQGHDHTYARTFKLRDGMVVPVDEKGTVYVVSVSGPKAYAINTKYKDLMAKIGDHISSFQVISVEANKLSFTSYTAAGVVYDSFELRK